MSRSDDTILIVQVGVVVLLLRVEATVFWFLVRLKFFHTPMVATSLTDLLSKLVYSETKREGKLDIKNNYLNSH